MLLAITLYMSFVYGVVYLLFEAYPFVFQQVRGWCTKSTDRSCLEPRLQRGRERTHLSRLFCRWRTCRPSVRVFRTPTTPSLIIQVPDNRRTPLSALCQGASPGPARAGEETRALGRHRLVYGHRPLLVWLDVVLEHPLDQPCPRGRIDRGRGAGHVC
jgi:hypothetical protein